MSGMEQDMMNAVTLKVRDLHLDLESKTNNDVVAEGIEVTGASRNSGLRPNGSGVTTDDDKNHVKTWGGYCPCSTMSGCDEGTCGCQSLGCAFAREVQRARKGLPMTGIQSVERFFRFRIHGRWINGHELDRMLSSHLPHNSIRVSLWNDVYHVRIDKAECGATGGVD